MKTAFRGPVLVVEDDPEMRRFLVGVLVGHGFRVITAVNGLEALERLRRDDPCVVLLDLSIPLLDGTGFVEAAQGDPEFPAVPIIWVSGSPDARQRAQRLGLKDCLSKPVDPEVLLNRVRRHCEPA